MARKAKTHRTNGKKQKAARSAELNRLIRIAALTIDPRARVKPLADKAGLSQWVVNHAIRTGRVTAGAACALELAFGRELLPKEKLCPEKFK